MGPRCGLCSNSIHILYTVFQRIHYAGAYTGVRSSFLRCSTGFGYNNWDCNRTGVAPGTVWRGRIMGTHRNRDFQRCWLEGPANRHHRHKHNTDNLYHFRSTQPYRPAIGICQGYWYQQGTAHDRNCQSTRCARGQPYGISLCKPVNPWPQNEGWQQARWNRGSGRLPVGNDSRRRRSFLCTKDDLGRSGDVHWTRFSLRLGLPEFL